jgi:hypothetical protein
VAEARRLLLDTPPSPLFWSPHAAMSWLVTALFAALMFVAACALARRSAAGDLI